MYLFLPVIFLLLFFPITIKIKINAKLKDKKFELQAISNMKNSVIIKLFKIIPVYHKKLLTKKGKTKKRKNSGIKIARVAFKTLKIDSLYLCLGVNTYSYIINSYLNALLNTTICSYINVNDKKFNFNRLYYQIYISENPFVINLEAEVSSSIARISYIIVKEKIRKNKSEKMNKKSLSCTY